MSFFANDGKTKQKAPAKKPAKKQQPLPTANQHNNSNDLPVVQNATAKPFAPSYPTQERAYYEPDGPEVEEEEVLPAFKNFRRSRTGSSNSESDQPPPPPPTRSGDNKQLMMLKLMKNATNALRS